VHVRAATRQQLGLVSFVGAGPGAADLLTCRAARRLAEADLVLHDGLVTAEVLALAPAAERLLVSRRPSAKLAGPGEAERTGTPSVATVARIMIEAARAGRRVVRLKAGDPFVLGRGGEEALALAKSGVPFEIVPGLTSAVGAPAVAGIPVTHRGVASGFVVVSGHSPEAYGPILECLTPHLATVVVLMGFAERAHIGAFLIEHGWPPDTPVAIITNASQEGQGTWTGALLDVGAALSGASPEDAHAIVIGDVVAVGAAIARGLLTPSEARSSYVNERGSEDVGSSPAVVCA
jgi:uroporphyrin-III C-methyltransferase/precorrin-2 dehydrogenase/sirohydrochlorin ferrochelatase